MNAPSPRPLRIVLADDTPDIRELLQVALERTGDFEIVAEAADGIEAIAATRDTRPDAVLLDLSMPRMDGMQAIPAILESSPDTTVVILSGFESSAMINEARSRGAQAYIPKGTPVHEIASKLIEVCGGRSPVDAPAPEATPSQEHVEVSSSSAVATIVHELRNQATVVEGFARTLSDGWTELADPERLRFLERVVSNARQMRSLVDVLGDVSRIDADALDLSFHHVSLGATVKEAVEDLATTLDRSIDCIIEHDATVRIDPTRMRQVLTNLLSNAAKFSPPATPISVTVRAEDDEAEVLVADCGAGIPPDRRDELFKPFARLGAEQPGTGLGLYISREIVRAHGGTLALADDNGTKGACFAIRLSPSAEERVAAQAAERS